MVHVISREELPGSTARRFEGHDYGANVSFFLSGTPPGKGAGLHTHPYAEVFVVQEGVLTFTVGDDTIEAAGGQIVVVPAGTPHGFVNPGEGLAVHVDIHTSGSMSTEWIGED
ncbi:cupin domain-containing protein [soil metagenome]